ncbi:MAG: SDR family NAD(P)-dependent oxidoreductase [bacterium]|jgi:NAD(P)-dependent dehydrogenase (short-subunit alcohol dehydrogenase family)
MNENMTGRTVIITGAAGGVGSEVTKRWVETGANVLAVERSKETLDNLRASLPPSPRFAIFPTDVTTEEGTAAMVEAARNAFEMEPDTLIHLVGGFAMGPLDSEQAPSQWENMLLLNLTSNFHSYRAILPALKRRGGGWILGIGSRVGVHPSAQMAAYAASKAGLIALTHALSEEVKDAGIHVNLLLASNIDTPANRHAMGDADAAKWITPDDIAEATLYLCSNQGRAVYGGTLEIYGRS